MATAVEAIRGGHSEKKLDALVEVALLRLGDIEQGYLDFHTNMLNVVTAHPKKLAGLFDNYEIFIASLLGLQEREGVTLHPEWEREAAQRRETQPDDGDASDDESLEGEDPATSSPPTPPPVIETKGTKKGSRVATPEPNVVVEEPIDDAEPVAEEEDLGTLRVSNDGMDAVEFRLVALLLETVFHRAIQQVEFDMVKDMEATATEALASEVNDTASEKVVVDSDADAGEAAEADATTLTPPTREEGEDEEAFAARLQSFKVARVVERLGLDARVAPHWRDGSECLTVLAVSDALVTEAVTEVSQSCLREMLVFQAHELKEAKAWAHEQDVSLTDELDENLRHHKPRAGWIEEGVREDRAVELLGQKRLVTTHLGSMGRALVKQREQHAARMASGQVRTRGETTQTDPNR